jgi:hypothetical protein
MFGLMAASLVVAAVLMYASHHASPGGGDQVCDYWRPRLRTTHARVPTTDSPLKAKPRLGGAAGTGASVGSSKATEMVGLAGSGAGESKLSYEAIADV